MAEKKPPLRLTNDKVAVKLDDPPRETPGGLLLPQTVKHAEGARRGVVVAVGPGRFSDYLGRRVEMTVKVGDVVWAPDYSGVDIKDGGTVVRVVTEDSVMAILNA